MGTKIAIYGLSADPLHKGHLEIIKYLSEHFDKVIVVPTTVRYYKKNIQMFSFNERFEVVKRKCECFKNVEVDDIERNAPDSWRYIDTLRKLSSGKIVESLDECQYYTVMGSDSWQNFTTWESYEEILKHSKILVFKRPGYEDNFPDLPFEYVDMNVDISSTEIREKMRKSFEEFLFDDILDESFTKGFEELLEK